MTDFDRELELLMGKQRVRDGECERQHVLSRLLALCTAGGGLFTREVGPDHILTIEIQAHELSSSSHPEEIELAEDRVLKAHVLRQRDGLLGIDTDTATYGSWEGLAINLGSVAPVRGQEGERHDLLKGVLALNGMVAVDTLGTDFDDPRSVKFLAAHYEAITIDGVPLY